MIQKLCPHCLQNSYSAYDNPRWICPSCGKDIGDMRIEKDEEQELISNEVRKMTARIIEFDRMKKGGS